MFRLTFLFLFFLLIDRLHFCSSSDGSVLSVDALTGYLHVHAHIPTYRVYRRTGKFREHEIFAVFVGDLDPRK